MTESKKISDAWNTVNWKQVQRSVYRLQQRIYRASQRGDTRTVQSLQRLLVKSWHARLLAVRRVTQENTGKKTAGVDGIKSLTPTERLRLTDTLALGKKANPLRRVWIPKPGKTEKRGLGIPTIHPNKGKRWVKDRYWHTIGSKNWVFGLKQDGKLILELKSFNEVSISYHTKVIGDKSWYDGDWAYWGTRRGEHPMIGTREATLLKRQNGRCTICRGVFDLYDQVEQDHALPRSKGGKDIYDNLQLLHSVCHHAKTSWDALGYCPIRPWMKESDSQQLEPETGFTEEPRGRQQRSRMR